MTERTRGSITGTHMHRSRASWAASTALASLLLLGSGCGGGSTTDPAPADPPASDGGGEVAAPAADASAKIDFQAARSRGKTAMFVPAPSEFQSALAAADVGVDLAALVGDGGNIEGKSKPVVALETGRRIASVLLSSKGGDKAKVSKHMTSAREGLAALGAPDDLLADVDKVVTDYNAGTISNQELAPSMDLLNQRVQTALNKGAGEEISTLVQAGGWVQGVHLLSKGLADAGQAGDGAALLHQPSVLSHFTEFIKNSSAAKAQDADVLAVITELEAMSGIAAKPELSVEDLKAVSTHTGNILARF